MTDEASQTDPPVGVTPIRAEEAKTLVGRYGGGATIPTKPFLGLYLDRRQAETIFYLLAKYPSLAGVRVYMGKEDTGKNVRIVVGVNDAYHDEVEQGILKTEAPVGGPCPPNCDTESPIPADYTA